MVEPIGLTQAGPSKTAGEAVEDRTPATDLLVRWQRGLRINHIMHSRASTFYERRGRALGVMTVLLTTIVSAGIFATFKESPSDWQRTVAGLLSAAAAVFASVQAFLGYSDLTERHRRCALEYGRLRRQIEQALEIKLVTSDQLSKIREAWDAVEKDAPPVPQSIANAARHEVMSAAEHDERALRSPSST